MTGLEQTFHEEVDSEREDRIIAGGADERAGFLSEGVFFGVGEQVLLEQGVDTVFGLGNLFADDLVQYKTLWHKPL